MRDNLFFNLLSTYLVKFNVFAHAHFYGSSNIGEVNKISYILPKRWNYLIGVDDLSTPKSIRNVSRIFEDRINLKYFDRIFEDRIYNHFQSCGVPFITLVILIQILNKNFIFYYQPYCLKPNG